MNNNSHSVVVAVGLLSVFVLGWIGGQSNMKDQLREQNRLQHIELEKNLAIEKVFIEQSFREENLAFKKASVISALKWAEGIKNYVRVLERENKELKENLILQ